MSLKNKIANAKTTNWLQQGLEEEEVKSIKELAAISAMIERHRKELGMNQKQFAEYMGVSQGMVSKWESGEYNFTIETLNEICGKINLKFVPVFTENRAYNIEQFQLIKLSLWTNDYEDKKTLDKSILEGIA
jgi:transcriptional regulator with XRE-family HTH domain